MYTSEDNILGEGVIPPIELTIVLRMAYFPVINELDSDHAHDDSEEVLVHHHTVIVHRYNESVAHDAIELETDHHMDHESHHIPGSVEASVEEDKSCLIHNTLRSHRLEEDMMVGIRA